MKSVQLAHGSGGQAMQQLIGDLFMQAFANPWLAEQEDQARLDLAQLSAQGDRLAFSTDSYVIDPLFFPGGNIGKLAVCGTANDVAVSGALPRYLSCGFILEEGLEMATLEAVVNSMAQTAREAGIAIVTGDTKVVPRGAADKLFINTAGIGVIPTGIRWGAQQISAGDVLLVSGTLSGCGIELHENKLPVNDTVRGVCELLGLDALNFANEGKLLIAVAREAAESVLAHLRSHPLGRDAAIIGEVVPRAGVRSVGLYGVKRTLDLPHAEPLPRIC